MSVRGLFADGNTGSGGAEVQDLVAPATRFTRWRLRSRTCAVTDLVVAVASACLFAVAALDSVVSWPSNHVLIGDRQLARVAGIVLGPGWPWLLASLIMVFGLPRPRRELSAQPPRLPAPWPPWARIGLTAAAVLSIAVIGAGFAFGAAKGSARVVSGPRYEVSTLDLNQASWTLVPKSQYELWQARFVREDAIFMIFGLVLAAGSVRLFQLHRLATRRGQD